LNCSWLLLYDKVQKYQYGCIRPHSSVCALSLRIDFSCSDLVLTHSNPAYGLQIMHPVEAAVLRQQLFSPYAWACTASMT
jgi:hypothetical protein